MHLALLLSALAALALPQAGQAQPAPASAPVVVELFTSQGCASCPPADALLSELASADGVIALALHVDYWDYLGWEDSFGRAAHTERQRAYAKAARSRTIFTPEMIVQGAERLKGHDADRIRNRIDAHRRQPAKAALSIRSEGDVLAIRLEPLSDAVGPADVHLVRFIPSEAVAIEGGENAGQHMTYTNIVTDWQTIARWDGQAPLELRHEGAGSDPLAVIVQQARMGPVLTAALWP